MVEYGRALQARAAEELGVLPDGSAIVEMLADYSVMSDQGAGLQLNTRVRRFLSLALG